MFEPIRIGIIGCGNISGIYLKNCTRSPWLNVVACADLDRERAEARAQEFGIRACSVDELLADSEVELVINLTVPKAHAQVAMAVIQAGKSVYNEKPLAIGLDDALQMLTLANQAGVRVGCAPDTFLGAGAQTCRKLIDDGLIGEPVAATAFMMSPGHESWHPNPHFYYEAGGGPLFDMGPYYLTTWVHLLGSIRRVTGSARITRSERVVTSKARFGERISVSTPTHIAGIADFAGGAVGTIITSFDVWAANLPRIEIYGTEGSLSVPDPNTFGGTVRMRRVRESDWHEIPLTHGYASNCRGLGVIDMAEALRTGRDHRASGALGYHVLEVMQAILQASELSQHIVVNSSCDRPAPLPVDSAHGEMAWMPEVGGGH